MKRTLGTIHTDGKGIGSIIHDSDEKTLILEYVDGGEKTSCEISDYRETSSWMQARKQIIAMYANKGAFHDSWVLCLRPIDALRRCHSEEV
jgi:hypothetical protein